MLGGGSGRSIKDALGDAVPASAATTLKVNWLFSIFMIAAVLGITAGLAGMRIGWFIAAGNAGGIVLSLAVAEYGRWLALGGIIAAVLAVAAMLLKNRQFQLHSVKSVEKLKEELPYLKGKINDVFFQGQNRTTEKMIHPIKAKLKKKAAKDEAKVVKKRKKAARKTGEAYFEDNSC